MILIVDQNTLDLCYYNIDSNSYLREHLRRLPIYLQDEGISR